VAQGVSALAVPLIALTYGGSGGFAMLFLVLAGMAFAVALSALLLPRMHPRPQHEPSAALAHGPVQGSRRGARAV
jgi:hypothetical protein